MYTYRDVVEFIGSIEVQCKSLLALEEKESSAFRSLIEKKESIQKNIRSINELLLSLSRDVYQGGNKNFKQVCAIANRIDIENLINDYQATKNEINDVKAALSCLNNEMPRVEANLKKVTLYIYEIEKHPQFEKWIKASEKYLHKYMLPKEPPAGLSSVLIENDLQNLLAIITNAGGLITNADAKLRYGYLYRIYRQTIETDISYGSSTGGYISDLKSYISYLNTNMMQLNSFISNLKAALERRLHQYERAIEECQRKSEQHPSKAHERLMQDVQNAYSETIAALNANSLRSMLFSLNNANVEWTSGTLKSVSDEKYLFSEHKGIVYASTSQSEYIQRYLEMVMKEYDFLFRKEGNSIIYHFPEIININTSEFNYIIDATKVCDREDKTIINSLVQHFVATTISNFPPGKTKFLFCDPDSTGVFSVFRDIGKIKDDVDESISCEYAGSAESIAKKLDSICVEIDDIVNKVIKGTTTTLYDHNRNNEFNSMPYRFIVLMDFPRNMTSSSLSSLRSILKNGPRCGIFTVLVNVGGEALSFLDDKMQVVVQEIVRSPALIYGVKRIQDIYNNEFGPFTTELNLSDFDKYIQEYNKKQKENEGFKIDISSLESTEVKNGSFSIPVGRSKGGKIESIAFFDHCQNYLLSGAIGRGKSNALHVIIHNSLKYVKDLDLYLIDFKHGVEFAPYARINHPSFKVLAIESAPEFGYSVLTHINDKISRIGEIFRENGVENWTELYKKTGKVIPVTLIIMDEFQHLFEGEHSKQCSDIVEFIAKEGRVFNVHLFLSSQTVNNLSGLTEAAKQMIFGRIVFFNDQIEYKSMLWDDDRLAKTFDPDIKGQAILATGQEHQRFIQFALKKPIEETIRELSYPESEEIRTKIMLSAVHENPHSIFNQFLKERITYSDDCELVVGDDIAIEPSDIKQRLEDEEEYTQIIHPNNIKSILLKHRQNDNMLILGNDERKAETLFIFSLLCTLMKQMTQQKENSISLIMVTTATDLYNLALRFPKYIKLYTTSDLLTDAVTTKTEYLFVFGLHAFSSMKFSVDDPYKKVNSAAQFNNPIIMGSQINGGVIIGDMPSQGEACLNYPSDGDMFRAAIDNSVCNTIVWHNDVINIANMFGTVANFTSFNNKFLHKICLPMSAKDSELFLGTDSGSKLSNFTLVYKFLNSEKILRIYNRFENKYLNKIINRLNEISGVK